MSLPTDQQLIEAAMEHHRAGRLPEAETLYRRLLAVHPGNSDILHLLGMLAHHTGHLPEAKELMRQAIAANPTQAHYYSNLGLLLDDLCELEHAAAAYDTAIRLQPNCAEAFYNLGNTRRRQRQWEAAILAYRSALQFQPDMAEAHLNLGLTLCDLGNADAGIATYRAALQRLPGSIALWNNLGNALKSQGQIDDAVEAYRAALDREPNHAVSANNLGNALKDQGRLDEAIACFRRSLTLNPTCSEVWSNLIFTLHFHPASTAETIAEECRRWRRQHPEPPRTSFRPHSNDRSPERRLRIGYVSPDFCEHVVGRTLLPVFEAHDREHFDLICYSEFGGSDAITEQFCSGSTCWRHTMGLSDEQVAAQIRADGIDLLVDLALHTTYNRLPVLAHKPAPVQISWLGYPGTTGLETIDYRLTDRFLDPPDADAASFIEEPIRLPDCWCCYQAPSDSPEVNGLPAARTGQITFGSFNNFSKINDQVLDLWTQILRALDGSRLVLLAKAGNHQAHTREFFRQRGISPQRLEFLSYRPAFGDNSSAEYLRRYQQIDIALDPFPYNGMTTTCDALWMGVPVIALVGRMSIGRASFSLLSNLGLAELAASSEEDYLRHAVELAQNLRRLAMLRTTLRDRMKSSPLSDVPRLARNVEAAYRDMWRRWCAARTS